jgi:hypothetical protein
VTSLQVAVKGSRSGGAVENGVRRRAGYRCRSRTGGCYERGNVGRNGRCFGSGDRRCCGRWHESRCGSRNGRCSGTRIGCGSGRRYGAETGCCWGSSTGGRCEGRAWGRSESCCSGRNGCGFRRCCGCWNRGRIRGRSSPHRLGDRENRTIQKPESRDQKPELSGGEGLGTGRRGRSQEAEAKSQKSKPGTSNDERADFDFREGAERTGGLVTLANRA